MFNQLARLIPSLANDMAWRPRWQRISALATLWKA
jgi:hypothetical protein